jgi:hypothetical protein
MVFKDNLDGFADSAGVIRDHDVGFLHDLPPSRALKPPKVNGNVTSGKNQLFIF